MKILIISPTPTHPTNAGNRLRIFTFCELLKKNGFEIHFLFIENEQGDKAEMAKYFNDNLFVFNHKQYLKSKHILDKLTHFVNRKKKRFQKKLKSKLPINQDTKFNYSLDYYYDSFIDTFIKEHGLDSKGFTHVLAEYVVFSKALNNFDDKTVKIIDLHDSLADRYKIYLANNAKPEFYSLTQQEEARGLNRAHHVIAIQQEEKEYYKANCDCNVEVIGHFTEVQKTAPSAGSTILFVGSQNKINIDGINHFIKNILPQVTEKDPTAKLLIAGNICERKDRILQHSSIEYLGHYVDPASIYDKGALVIIPLIYGTGLKIKTIEALSFGKAVITFDEGLRGLPKPTEDNRYCILAKDDAGFADGVQSLLKDPGLRQSFENNAVEFMKKYNAENLEAFNRIFS